MRDQRPGDLTPIKILHVVWRLSKGGGIPGVVRTVASGLDTSRFEVHVASFRPVLEEDGLEDLCPPASFHHIGGSGRQTRASRLVVALRLARLTRWLRPDVLHVHSGTAACSALAALAARPPVRILDIHAAPGVGHHGLATERLEAQLCRRLRFHPLVHSRSVQEAVAVSYGMAPSDIDLIPLGVDTERFGGPCTTDGRWRADHGVPADAVLALYVARLAPSKNVGLLLDVARLTASAGTMPPVVFAVVGAGPERDRLVQSISEHGLGEVVRLLGPMVGDDLVSAFRACDVFVSPSEYESFGLAIVEAMAAAKPSVATRVGGISDVVDDGRTGILVPRGDAAALAAALLDLVEDPARRAELGYAARERARTLFDHRAMASAYGQLYERRVGMA